MKKEAHVPGLKTYIVIPFIANKGHFYHDDRTRLTLVNQTLFGEHVLRLNPLKSTKSTKNTKSVYILHCVLCPTFSVNLLSRLSLIDLFVITETATAVFIH